MNLVEYTNSKNIIINLWRNKLAIPNFQEVMRPLLNALADNNEHNFRDLVMELANHFNLTDEDKSQLLPSGTQEIFANRVGWAKFYMQKAGLLSTVRRGVYQITETGQTELKNQGTPITVEYLRKYPQFVEFVSEKNRSENTTSSLEVNINNEADPIETIENEFKQLNYQLALDLLDRIKTNPPQFFENLVAELLIKMGYGSSKQDILKKSGHSGDEGIDGIIKEDPLGLNKIYLQAKRWQGTIGRPEIQKFAGALQMQNASKGLFITTSSYTRDAIESLPKFTTNIVLIDGIQLTELMVKYNLGVTTKNIYELKRVDEDYFIIE